MFIAFSLYLTPILFPAMQSPRSIFKMLNLPENKKERGTQNLHLISAH